MFRAGTLHNPTPQSQGYLAHKNPSPPWDPTVGLSRALLCFYGGLRFVVSEVPLYWQEIEEDEHDEGPRDPSV
jgi:hypothetical protein